MGCDGSYQSNKDEMVTELKTYDDDTSSCPSSGCVFVAVGGSGTILTSSDGISWTSRTSGTSKDLKGISYGNNIFLAANNIVLSSSDGQSWNTTREDPVHSVNQVFYYNSIFTLVYLLLCLEEIS